MLPADIIDVVLSFASCPTAVALARSCKAYNQLLKEKGWITLLKSRVEITNVSNEEAKQLLIDCFLNPKSDLIIDSAPNGIKELLVTSVGNSGNNKITRIEKIGIFYPKDIASFWHASTPRWQYTTQRAFCYVTRKDEQDTSPVCRVLTAAITKGSTIKLYGELLENCEISTSAYELYTEEKESSKGEDLSSIVLRRLHIWLADGVLHRDFFSVFKILYILHYHQPEVKVHCSDTLEPLEAEFKELAEGKSIGGRGSRYEAFYHDQPGSKKPSSSRLKLDEEDDPSEASASDETVLYSRTFYASFGLKHAGYSGRISSQVMKIDFTLTDKSFKIKHDVMYSYLRFGIAYS